MHMDPLINTACRTATVVNPINVFPTDLTDLVDMKPSGSLLLLLSMVYLFLFAGEYYVYIWNEILDQTGQCQQSWCDVAYDNDDEEEDKDYNGDKKGLMMVTIYHTFRRNFIYN